MSLLSRREFVVASILTGLGIAARSAAAAARHTAGPETGWFDRPMRWLVESPGHVDVTVPSILDHEVVAIDL